MVVANNIHHGSHERVSPIIVVGMKEVSEGMRWAMVCYDVSLG